MTIQQFTVNGETAALSHYGSVAEMEADYSRPFVRSANKAVRHRHETYEYGGSRWYGVESLAKVKQAMRKGYAEGAKRVDDMFDRVQANLPRAIDFRRHLVRSDQGDSLDIHAVNRGNLSHAWTTSKRKAKLGTGLIRIVVDVGGNCGVTAETLQWRGVAALALCRAMTKAGYSVEIVVGFCTEEALYRQGDGDKPRYSIHTTTVKPRSAAVDTATLAATACLPGFFRYAGFGSIVRQAEDLGCYVDEGLGHIISLESVLPVPDKIAQVVTPHNIYDQTTAEKWVTETVGMLQGATMAKESGRS